MFKIVSPTKERLVKLICAQGVPYGVVMKSLRAKDVKVNGKRQSKDCFVEAGDVIEVYTPFTPANTPSQDKGAPVTPSHTDISAKNENIKTIYSDENVAVVIKPQGEPTESFSERLKSVFPTAEAVHRLDVNTFGVMIFALNENAKTALDLGFKQRTFEKYYITEVTGEPKQDEATLTAYLKKDAEKSTVYVHKNKGQGDVQIVTAYKKIPRFCAFSGASLIKTDKFSNKNNEKAGIKNTLIEVKLITGKTHQIRAHLAFEGMPIIGDDKYGDRTINKKLKATRQRLASYKITLHFEKNSPFFYLDGKTFGYFDEAKYNQRQTEK